jgi:hypothetical protein
MVMLWVVLSWACCLRRCLSVLLAGDPGCSGGTLSAGLLWLRADRYWGRVPFSLAPAFFLRYQIPPVGVQLRENPGREYLRSPEQGVDVFQGNLKSAGV